LIHGFFRDFLVVVEHSAAVRLDEADNHVKSGRFAGSIWSKQANNLPLFDVE
jgi:hypothetical protein